MNAIAANGMNQAGLLASFPFPLAHPAPATPAFASVINLMLSTPSSATPFQATAKASPAQIADAMIRSMLGGPIPGNAAGLATDAQADPTASLNKAFTKVAAATTQIANLTLPGTAIAPDAGSGAKQRKQAPTADDAAMASAGAAVPAQAMPVATAPMATGSADDSKAKAPATTPLPAIPTDSPAVAPLAKGMPEAKVAFTAILTPTKEASAPAAATPQAVGGNSSVQSTQLAPAGKPQASSEGTTQATASELTEAGGNATQDGDASSRQDGSSSETPARSLAATSSPKIKAGVNQDEDALQPVAAGAGVVHTAAVPSFATSPSDSTRASVSAQSEATEATPYNATAEALRTTESNLAPETPARTGAAQEISIRIAPPDAPAVDLRVVERAGQVHVDVRTADAAMQTNLRQDLGTLTNSLERAGYHTETFTPASTLSRAASSAQTGNQDNQDPSQNRGGAGDFSGGRRQQQQHQKRSGQWLEDLEEQP